MEIGQNKISKAEEHHLSGAYIRSLVKQLTSPKTDDPMNLRDIKCPAGLPGRNSPELGLCQSQQPQQPLKHKKQVRRRLHTTRPYQERLLNMAEARKEIVTALKYHRASMKHAQQQHPPSKPCFEQEQGGKTESRRNPRIYPSNTPSPSETHNLTLPTQPLGLNLNLNDITNPYQNCVNQSSIYSYVSSPSSSYSPTLSVVTNDTPSSAMLLQEDHNPADHNPGLHQAMGEEEMAAIRSIGKQHEMEWNDTMNLMTSAWWFRFFKEEEEEEEEGMIDEFIEMQIPSWFNPNQSIHQDSALPW